MIVIEFRNSRGNITGFTAKGHSMSAPKGEDIICSAVSSACLMSANTVTEIIHLEADAKMEDGFLSFDILGDSRAAQDVLNGLKLHLSELASMYPKNIIVNITEV